MAVHPISVAGSWWAMIIRGIAAIIFGILAFAVPGITLAVLVALFGAYALIDGIFSLIAAARGGAAGHRVWLVLEGIVGILAGLAAFFWPGLTAVVLLFVIASWAVVTGILELIAAVRLRDVISNEWGLVLAGIASLIFGVLLFVSPRAGILAVVWLIGAYAIIFGILLLVVGVRMKSYQT